MVAPATIASAQKILVGVQFAVTSINKFNKQVSEVKSILNSIKPKATLIERAFKSLSDRIKDFSTNVIVRILTIAFGVLARDAIQTIIYKLGEMINVVIEATNEFQALEIRLNTFNLNSLIESGLSYNKAIRESIKLTKDQLEWAIKLAKASPYDVLETAAGYSLARSYGFADEKARKLTNAILDFSAGMGLNNDAIERIITNLGQMSQQGKITGTELRDLARGSFVPVNKILGMVAKNLGITTSELNKLRKAGTTDPQWFIDAFIQLADTEFAGASERMSRTFGKAIGNMKDLFLSLFTLHSIKPVFDALGASIANLVEAFDDKKFAILESLFKRIGRALVNIVNGILGLLPSAESMSDTIIDVIGNIAVWLEKNRNTIVEWAKKAIELFNKVSWAVGNVLIPFIKYELLPALQRLKEWFIENKTMIILVVSILIAMFLAWEIGVINVRLQFLLLGFAFKSLLAPIKFLFTSIKILFAALALALEAIPLLFIKVIIKIRSLIKAGNWEKLGLMIIFGIVNGLFAGLPILIMTVFKIISWIITIFKSAFGMHSPSKVMANHGLNIMLGLANGIKLGGLVAISAAKDIADQVAGVMGITNNKVGQNLAGQFLGKNNDVMRGEMTKGEKEDPCASGIDKCITAPIVTALGGIGDPCASGIDECITAPIVEKLGEIRENNERWIRKNGIENDTGNFWENMSIDSEVLWNQMSIDSKAMWEDIKRSFLDNWTGVPEEIANKITTSTTNGTNKWFSYFITKIDEIAVKFLNIPQAIIDFLKKFDFSDFFNNWGKGGSGFDKKGFQFGSTVPTQGRTYNSNVRNLSVTNNFNHMQKGQSITMDYEDLRFWV